MRERKNKKLQKSNIPMVAENEGIDGKLWV
jgi:hypothetical protein